MATSDCSASVSVDKATSRVVVDSDPSHLRPRSLDDLSTANAAHEGRVVAGSDAQVVGDAEVGEQPEVLMHEAEVGAAGGVGRPVADWDPGSVDLDLQAGVGGYDPGEQLDRCRLSGSVAAHDGVDLAGVDRQ